MSASECPLVSIVMPAYNEEEFVERAISSVLRQTYSSIELIVVDDGSTDATVERVRNYERQLQLVTTSNEGASHARNLGASVATGEFLVFSDADDLLGPTAIEGLVRTQISVDTSRAIAVCDWDYLVLGRSGDWVRKSPGDSSFDPDEEDALTAWISGRFYPSCSLMWSRRFFEEIGGWDESLTTNQDGDLVMRGLVSGGRIIKSETGRSFYRHHSDGERISARHNKEAFRSRWKVVDRVDKALQKNGRLGSYRIDLGRAYHALAKNFYRVDSRLARECERRAGELAGPQAVVGSRLHRLLYRTVGLTGKERLRALFHGFTR